ncbi:MAG: endonuclease domain-containing protein [Coriobacteriia bacterium]|nr:endonuclease domain-containing protein [Coriobacteriia bacterium]
MSAFISHESALEYWRKLRVIPDGSIRQQKKVLLPEKPPTTKQVKQIGLTQPVHVMFRKANTRWVSQTMRQHVFSSEVAAGCFIKVKSDLAVSSPEYCFLQMAGTLSLIKLIELSYELCGGYSLPNKNELNPPERGFYQRNPLASSKSLCTFVERMTGHKGRQKANRALRCLQADSASPMETRLTMLLTLPYQLGGFGLSAPTLNSRVYPEGGAKKVSHKSSYVCDLFWSEKMLAVEYDSEQHHSSTTKIFEDAKRRNALNRMGITVVTVTKQQLYNSAELEKVARIIASYLRKRLVLKNPGFAQAHRALREELFEP